MPVTSQNYKRYQAAIAKASQDPNFDKGKLNALQGALNTFLENATDEDLNPTVKNTEQFGPPPPPDKPLGEARDFGGYYYNPSLEEFRNEIQKPDVQSRIGISGDYSAGVKSKSAGADYLESKVPELANLSKKDVDLLTQDSEEYKKYADAKWQQEQERDPSLKRYEDISLRQNPFSKLGGGALKYGPSALLGAEKTIGLGIPRRAAAVMAGNIPDSAADVQYDPMGAPIGEYHPEKAAKVDTAVKSLESLSPEANAVGQFAGYLAPIAPANLAQGAITEGLGYAARGPLAKAAIGSLTGSTVASGEGAIQDITENPGISRDELWNRFIPRLGWGALGGGALDFAAQGASKARLALQETPAFQGIKNLKDAGGGTHVLKGVEAPPVVHENLSLANKGREFKHAEDIAAMKVAPQIKDSLQKQEQAAFEKSGNELEAYLNQPEIANAKENMRPVAEGILDMFKKGTLEGAVTGDVKHVNPEAVSTFKKVLGTIGEVKHMNPNEAALFAKNNNGILMDHEHMKALGMPAEEGKVPVYIPSNTSPRALLEMEQMIDDKLKMAGTEGGINNPIWKNINKNIKSVRDKFGAPVPQFSEPPNPFNPTIKTSEGPIKAQTQVNVEQPTVLEGKGTLIPKNRTEPAGPIGTPRDLTFQQDLLTGVRRELTPSEYAAGVELEGPHQRLSEMTPEAVQSLKELGYEDALRAQNRESPRLERLAKESDTIPPEKELPPNPYNDEMFGSRQADRIRYEQQKIGDLDPETIAAKQRVQERKLQQLQGRGINNELSNAKTVRPGPEFSIEELGSSAVVPDSSAPPVDAMRMGPENETFNPRRSDPILRRYAKNYLENTTPEQHRLNLEQYKTDAKEMSDEFNFYNPERSRDNERALNWAKEANPVQEPYISKSELEKEMARREWGHAPDQRLTPENFNRVEQEAARRFGVVPGEAEMRPKATSKASSIGAEKTSVAAPRQAPKNGLESQLDAQLLQRDIADQAKLEGVPNPLKPTQPEVRPNPNRDPSVKPPKPAIPEATLDDGTKVYGLSAMQRKHHLAMKAVQDAEKLAGTGTEGSAHNRVLKFKSGPGNPYNDEVIAREADELGLRQQLEEVTATRDYPGLRARAWGGGQSGPLNAIKDVIGFRLDPFLGAVAGDAPNPFTAPPNTPAGRIQRYLFRTAPSNLLNMKGGLGAARFIDDFVDEKE